MALSRFWLTIFIASILIVLFSLLSGTNYSLDYTLNGAKGDLILVGETKIENLPNYIKDSFLNAKMDSDSKSLKINFNPKDADTTYTVKGKGQIIRILSGKQKSDGILVACKNTLIDLILPLIAMLAFFTGIMQLLIDSGAAEKLAKFCSPLFVKIFPGVPPGHASISYMTLNFAANFLGLDSAATPFGLKAMQSLQEINPDKDKASDAQIMFMCLHAAGLCLIPTSIIGYRSIAGAQNPADVMLPCIITSFVGTISALIIVGIKQKVNLLSSIIVTTISILIAAIIGLLLYVSKMDLLQKNYFTSNLSTIILYVIIVTILGYAFYSEKKFKAVNTDMFSSFVTGAKSGMQTAITVFPYMMGMLAAISIFRNSGFFDVVSTGIGNAFRMIGVSKDITDGLPVALLRPFSSSGSRGFLMDAMDQQGADSFTGRLCCIFQCSAETTFYVLAVYFGSINIKNTRYTLGIMLMVDLICVIAAIGVAKIFF
jgi:spore maturation protein SpmA